jgi:hypothetical protein
MSVYMIYVINIIMNFLNVCIYVLALRSEYARALTFEFFFCARIKGLVTSITGGPARRPETGTLVIVLDNISPYYYPMG